MKQVYNPVSGQFDLVGSGVIAGTINRIPFFDSATSISDSYLIQTPTGILIDAGILLQSSGAISGIDLQDSYLDLYTDSTFNESWISLTGTTAYIGYDNNAITFDSSKIIMEVGAPAYRGLTISTSAADAQSTIVRITTDIAAGFTNLNANPGYVFINSTGTFLAGTSGSVIIAGVGMYAKSDNVLYTRKIGYATGASFETLVGFIAPTANNSINFQNASGTLAFLSDVGVTSVTGTTNRITSTGGATPVIDISATFEALLGKVANPLSQFAATTSLQLLGVISDETGTGSLVFANAPTLVNPIVGTQTALDNSQLAASTRYVDLAVTAGTLKTKAITIASGSFAGNPKKATVTFATAFADALYSISIVGADSRSWSFESKLAGSFVINSNANTALTGDVTIIAIKTGEN